MAKQTIIALIAMLLSVGAYAVNDIKKLAQVEERVKTVCADLARLQQRSTTVPVLENRVLHLEENTNRLITKMDRVLDALATHKPLKGGD